jgi:hypothetical protein
VQAHNKGTKTTRVTSYGNFERRKDQRQSPTRTTAKQRGEIVVGLCAKIHRSAESTDLHNSVESKIECSKGMPPEMKLDRITKMAKAGRRRPGKNSGYELLASSCMNNPTTMRRHSLTCPLKLTAC